MSVLIRPMRSRDPHESHRAATTLELFFDLVSVIAIAAVTAGFHHAISEGHGLEALPKFIFLFLAVWWAWMNLTWFASAFDNGDKLFKMLVMLIMGGELLFAGGAGFIFETMDFSYGLLGWVLMRFGMVCLWLRAAHTNPEYRGTALRYAAGITIAQIFWCLLYFGTAPGSTAFFIGGAACFLVEWSVPPVAESHRQTPFHRHHIIERYGLLMIISLGELVLSISHGYSALFGDHPSMAAAVVSTAALVIVFAIWEVYFWEPEHLPNRRVGTAVMWGYVHVLIFGATAALGAAIAASIDVATHHGHTDQATVSLYFGTAFAVWMLALWAVRDRILPLARAQALCLPVMAGVTLLAGLFGAPVWVFAVLAVGMSLWRTARPPVEMAEP